MNSLGHYVPPCYGREVWSRPSRRSALLSGSSDIVENLRRGINAYEAAGEALVERPSVLGPRLEPPDSILFQILEEGRKVLSDDRFWYLAAGFALAQWRQE